MGHLSLECNYGVVSALWSYLVFRSDMADSRRRISTILASALSASTHLSQDEQKPLSDAPTGQPQRCGVR